MKKDSHVPLREGNPIMFTFRHLLFNAGLIAMLILSAALNCQASDVGDDEEIAVEADSIPSYEIIAKAFRLIPDRDLDILTKPVRQDMVIYMENDSIYKARNIYTGFSWIEKMNPDYMRVHLTDVSNLQIKRLPTKKMGNPLIMTIYTIAGDSDTADSTIKFYTLADPASEDATLTELPMKKYFKLPDPKYFYDMKSGEEASLKEKMKLKDILEEMPFHTVAYTISPDSDQLTGRLTVSNYLTLETRKRLEPYIREELRWDWDGKSFKLITR